MGKGRGVLINIMSFSNFVGDQGPMAFGRKIEQISFQRIGVLFVLSLGLLNDRFLTLENNVESFMLFSPLNDMFLTLENNVESFMLFSLLNERFLNLENSVVSCMPFSLSILSSTRPVISRDPQVDSA